MFSKKLISCSFILFLLYSCGNRDNSITTSPIFIQQWRQWQQERLQRLKSENGWLNLAGLYWLKEGENRFGSDSSNHMVFPPKAPSFAGVIIRNDSLIQLKVLGKTVIRSQGKEIKEMKLLPDSHENTTILEMGSFRFFVIKRDSLWGIRLRDLESPLLSKLDSIPCYPPDSAWKISAQLIPYKKAVTKKIHTVIGTEEEYLIPGILKFTLQGKELQLLPFQSGKGFFLLFGDATSALETYGAGRFLNTGPPDSLNRVMIDFNRAYNPPCAFTPYATCPLPPRENLLPLEIKAGEKDPKIYSH